MTTDLLRSILTPALLTSDLPGLGGRIKSTPDDFEVEEVPAYAPSGEGDFLYLWVEKRDMGAEFFTREVARRLGVGMGDIGAAGLKDRRAVTRQWLSVPAAAEANLSRLDGDGIRVLQVSRHTNKLRAGHLHGNRFRILVRDVVPGVDVDLALPQLLERLKGQGLPNYYGSQRFGKEAETLRLGLQMVFSVGGTAPPPALAALVGEQRTKSIRNPFLKKLALSAAQSALFNLYLERRLADGLWRTVLAGDVMAKLPAGGMFTAEDVAAEQQRFDAREITHAGPIFGKKTFPAKHAAADRERQTLEAFGLDAGSFSGFGKLLQGTRRHNLVYLDDLTWAKEADGLRLTFTLPAGSYATVLLREIMKAEIESDER